MAKATHVYEIPSGSFVQGVSPNITKVYNPDGRLILTVIDQSEKGASGAIQSASASGNSYSDWIEFAYYNSYGGDPIQSFKYFYAEWIVPTQPINSWIDDDTVYLFNGIQGQGTNDRTSGINVAVGDLVSGMIAYNPSESQPWLGVFWNKSVGKFVSLKTNLLGNSGQFITVALEGRNLETNSDLFGTTDFNNMYVQALNGEWISPLWHKEIRAKYFPGFTGLDVVIFNAQHVRLKTDR